MTNEIKKDVINKICDLHLEIEKNLKLSLGNAIEIGSLLAEQKKTLPHGKFTAWIDSNMPFSDRTARNYMRLHENKDILKTETVSDLAGAYKLLTHQKEQMPELTIDDEFSKLLPPLQDYEYEGLKRSIKKEGCIHAVEVWNHNGQKIILDGHQRYKICKELNIPFSIREKAFDNRYEAEIWIIENQLGRCNLNEYQKAVIIAEYEDKAEEGEGCVLNVLGKTATIHNI